MNQTHWIRHMERNSRRSAQIIAVLAKYGLADWLHKIPGNRIQEWLKDDHGQPISDLKTPERIRLALTELGTTFIKLGQMLSTRPDVMGKDLAHELEKLQSDTPPDPPRTAQATVRSELGRSVKTLFAHFEPEAFASASIAQVHYARLHSGEKVVVKIRKRGIEETIEADLSILADLAGLAENQADLKRYRPVALVEQFTQQLRAELDFTRERRNLETFCANFAEDDFVHFPKPYAELSSQRVLTMERLQGIPFTHIAKARAHVSDLNIFARRGATVYMEMIFRDGFFHADPHPGNLMLLEGDVLGVVDAGMVQHLDDGTREKLVDVLLAVNRRDAESLADSVCALATTPPSSSREGLRSDCTSFLDEYAGQDINNIHLSQPLTTFTDVIQRNDIFLPPNISLLLRMLIELEGTAQLLAPTFSLLDLIQPYCEKALIRRFSPAQIYRRLRRNAHIWHQLMDQLPRNLNDILEQIRAGTLNVHLEHRRLDPVVNRLVRGLVASSLFLGSSLLWSMKAPPLIRGVSLFGVIGYALALIIGLKLLRGIRRSEKSSSDDV